MEKTKDTREFRDILQIEGIYSRGFGNISKMVMLDRKLTIEAKAIYSYFASYAGAGAAAFPCVQKILEDLCISEDRYYTHFAYLKAYGYIKVTTRKSENNKYISNIYTLVFNPEPNEALLKALEDKKNKPKKVKSSKEPINKEFSPSPQIPGTGKNEQIPYPDFPGTEIPSTENQGINNNMSFFNNNILLDNKHSVSQSKTEKTNHQDRQADIPILDEKDLIEKEIQFKESINYDYLIQSNNSEKKFIDELVSNMLDMHFSEYTMIQGDKKPQAIIRSALIKINHPCYVEYIIKQYNKVTEKIKNKKAYLQTMIYNSVLELDANTKNDVALLPIIEAFSKKDREIKAMSGFTFGN